jgi:hypothetical protein
MIEKQLEPRHFSFGVLGGSEAERCDQSVRGHDAIAWMPRGGGRFA